MLGALIATNYTKQLDLHTELGNLIREAGKDPETSEKIDAYLAQYYVQYAMWRMLIDKGMYANFGFERLVRLVEDTGLMTQELRNRIGESRALVRRSEEPVKG